MAETLGFKVTTYELSTIEASSISLSLLGSTTVGYAVDNLELSTHGNIIAAGHPDPRLVPWVARGVPDPTIAEAYRAQSRPGSRIVTIKPELDKMPEEWKVEIVFEDDGNYFGTSSTGVVDEERGIVLGSGLYDVGVLVCKKVPEERGPL